MARKRSQGPPGRRPSLPPARAMAIGGAYTVADRPRPASRPLRRNEDVLSIDEVRLVGVDGKALGIVSSAEALERARAAGVDRIEVVHDAAPPTWKLVIWRGSLARRQRAGSGPLP